MGATVVVVACAVVGEAVVVIGAVCDQCKASKYGSGVSQEFGINTTPTRYVNQPAVVVEATAVVVVVFAVVGDAVVVVGAACDRCKVRQYGSGASQNSESTLRRAQRRCLNN